MNYSSFKHNSYLHVKRTDHCGERAKNGVFDIVGVFSVLWMSVDIGCHFGPNFELALRTASYLSGPCRLIHVIGCFLMALNRYTAVCLPIRHKSNQRIVTAVVVTTFMSASAVLIIRTACGMRNALKSNEDIGMWTHVKLLSMTAVDCILSVHASAYCVCAAYMERGAYPPFCTFLAKSYLESTLLYFTLNALSICVVSRSFRGEVRKIYKSWVPCKRLSKRQSSSLFTLQTKNIVCKF
ncbi:hypothetical protein Y032_0279g1209 [Ancylostoma ceylanicum]|uniref:Uncharacterized protein n=1 Tax=Ancylostoma ceylanicum TaxID=53326 RepID=A0A016S856_9BILA|nr:hypothetical protein Y032_0279g1209 [Ancylostoma ceylanicum]